MKNKSLVETHPHLAKQWHPIKNDNITPDSVTPGSGKKIWWLGKCGHEWEAAIYSRSRYNAGCPYCVNQKVLKGFNDLSSKCPDLAKEWHPIENGNVTPSDIVYSSNKKAWWLCEYGHSWQAQISSRSRENTDCPYCSGHKPWKGFNDLATLNPDLAREWHPTKNGNLTPSDVLPSISKNIWWQCEKGHEWEAVINNRASGTGCPYCSNQKVLQGYNDLETTHPELAREWHPTKNRDLTPQEVTCGSGKKVWWLCEFGHEWRAQIKNRKHGRGCSFCQKENRTSFPEQAFYFYLTSVFHDAINTHTVQVENKIYEIDIYIPSINLGVEYDGYHWHKNTEERDKLKSLDLKDEIHLVRIREAGLGEIEHSKCFHCLNIEKTISELFTYITQLLPVNMRIKEKIKKIDINLKRDEIEINTNFISKKKENSLYSKNPDVAKEWHPTKNKGLKPTQFLSKSNKSMWWQCSKGHEWYEKISNRTVLNYGCPICSGKRVLAGFNDLATTHPKLAKQWHPTLNGNLTPQKITAGSNKEAWWRCEHGHEWKTLVTHRGFHNTGCPYCSGRTAIEGETDLATTHPELAKQWHPTKNGGLTPCDIKAGYSKKVWWQCSKGHEWEATANNRSSNHKGCPYCSGRTAIEGKTDLATTHPELAKQWHLTLNGDLTPQEVSAGSNKKVWWRCGHGHKWQAIIANRSKGNGCPYCSGHSVLSGFNDLATTHPKLAKQWYPTLNGDLTPQEVSAGSNKKVWWRCGHGHKWQAIIANRSRGNGCPYCSNRKVLPGFNDLETTHPEVAKE